MALNLLCDLTVAVLESGLVRTLMALAAQIWVRSPVEQRLYDVRFAKGSRCIQRGRSGTGVYLIHPRPTIEQQLDDRIKAS